VANRVGLNKYHARKVTLCGETFDSQRECNRYCELAMLQKAGEISGLRRQVKYELIPAQKVGGKTVERATTYIADFVYNEDGKTVVEDVKGVRTPEYKIKRKLMLWLKGIRIKEV
jgi:hypothetical protein